MVGTVSSSIWRICRNVMSTAYWFLASQKMDLARGTNVATVRETLANIVKVIFFVPLLHENKVTMDLRGFDVLN